jgi:hypothetical protein
MEPVPGSRADRRRHGKPLPSGGPPATWHRLEGRRSSGGRRRRRTAAAVPSTEPLSTTITFAS